MDGGFWRSPRTDRILARCGYILPQWYLFRTIDFIWNQRDREQFALKRATLVCDSFHSVLWGLANPKLLPTDGVDDIWSNCNFDKPDPRNYFSDDDRNHF